MREISPEMLGCETLEEAQVLGDEVLIGQTVLGKLDLLADAQGRGADGRVPGALGLRELIGV